jgi:sterol desaturase/sphingolipid hydroxylase (fatty acid hydroxylase superfamily)
MHHDQPVLRPQWTNDLVYVLINGLLIRIGLGIAILGAVLLGAWLVPASIQHWVGSLPFLIQLPVLIILSDIGFYSVHRLFHKIPFLWKFHAVHHSIEDLDWLAAHRVHPVDQILTKGVSLLPVFALGFSTAAIAAYAVIYHWQSLLIHSNVRISFGPLRWLVASPQFHHWHHANHKEAFDKNFAGHRPIVGSGQNFRDPAYARRFRADPLRNRRSRPA